VDAPAEREPAVAARRRERVARLVGVGVALLAMILAWRSIGWPAPGVSIALGFGAYWLTRAAAHA